MTHAQRDATTGRDVVVCLVSDTFTDARRRGFYSTADQTLLSLVESPRIRRVLVVDHPRGLLSQLKRRVQHDLPARRSGKLRGLRPVTLSSELPDDVASATRRYVLFDRQIEAAVRRHGMRDPFLLTFNLLHAGLGSHRFRHSAFYAQDDELEIPRFQAHRELLATAYERVATRHDATIAVTGELSSRFSSSGLVIPNGVDPHLWQTVPAVVPRTSGAPRAVYAGTIDSRVDTRAFVDLAASGFEVVLAGPVPDAEVRAELERTPGVRLAGSLTRDEVVVLLRSADVCVLAHRRTRLTEAMSPLKLFEYLASGTPVVATDLPGTREGWPAGVFVPAGGNYAAAARSAIARGRLSEPARRRLVSELSWRRRHETLLDLVQTRSRGATGS